MKNSKRKKKVASLSALSCRNRVYPARLREMMVSKDAAYWQRLGERMALKLFHRAASEVPAYKDFLKRHGVRSGAIRTFADLTRVPTVSKENYLHTYGWDELRWANVAAYPGTMHASSGSTGAPTYFRRNLDSDLRREFLIEMFLRQDPDTLRYPTLFIISFGLGIWSAGMGLFVPTYLAINRNKYPITIATPGVNKVEVVRLLKAIAPHYRTVVIAGYPPFVKDALDTAEEEGADLRAMRMRMLFTGEAFTENLRDYFAARVGIPNIYTDETNTYGTSELGPIGLETPLSILLRRIADPALRQDLFGERDRTPTLVQSMPHFVHCDAIDGRVAFTGDNSIPLVRYDSADRGGVLSYARVREIMHGHGLSLEKEAKKAGIGKFLWQLPFVYVFERANLAVTLYGIIIFPEYLKAITYAEEFSNTLTGKFTMRQRYDEAHNQYLEINVELKPGVRADARDLASLQKRATEVLRSKSSEFAELERNNGERVHPRVVAWPHEHPEYFTAESKHRWTART